MSENASKINVSDFNVNPRITRSEGYKTIYANAVKLALSPWDLRITFSQTLEVMPPEIVNEELITVVMSPQQAKAAMIHWVNTVKIYEDTFGTIPDIGKVIGQKTGLEIGKAAVPKKKKD